VLFSSHQLDLVEDLCQDVVIIEHGRIVLAGELEALRAAVPQRFVEVHVRGEPPDWSHLPSVEVVEAAEGRVRLRVGPGTDLAAMLTAAQQQGELVSFSYQPPTLSELFRRAVGS
jgi:ABC-2 type transport system ATP-binding protein